MTTEHMRYGGSTATPEIPKEAYHSNPTLEGHFARLRLQRRAQSMAELRSLSPDSASGRFWWPRRCADDGHAGVGRLPMIRARLIPALRAPALELATAGAASLGRLVGGANDLRSGHDDHHPCRPPPRPDRPRCPPAAGSSLGGC